MAEGKVTGVVLHGRKLRAGYAVASWKVSAMPPGAQMGESDKTMRRVIFRKPGKTQTRRLELRGQPGDLARMFNEIAAALWCLDGSERGIEPGEQEVPEIIIDDPLNR